MAALINYRLPAARSLVGPLALGVVALGAAALVGGVRPSLLSHAPAASTNEITRYQHEVLVKNAGRGCRWQYTADPASQTAECGDETENVRVVFRNGQVTEYRISARTDPNARTTAVTTPAAGRPLLSGTPAAGASSASASGSGSVNVAGASTGSASAANAGVAPGAPPSR